MLFRPRLFLLNYAVALAVVFCTTKLLNFAPGLRAGLSVPLIMPLLFASMIEGRHFAQCFQKRPVPRTCWKIALSMFGLLAVFVAPPILAMVLIMSELPAFSLLHLLLVLSIVPALRIGYGLGVGSELKAVRQPLL